jgi:hypothetical protein
VAVVCRTVLASATRILLGVRARRFKLGQQWPMRPAEERSDCAREGPSDGVEL